MQMEVDELGMRHIDQIYCPLSCLSKQEMFTGCKVVTQTFDWKYRKVSVCVHVGH